MAHPSSRVSVKRKVTIETATMVNQSKVELSTAAATMCKKTLSFTSFTLNRLKTVLVLIC